MRQADTLSVSLTVRVIISEMIVALLGVVLRHLRV